ncbi:hypothetical protein L0P73_21470 [[Clostridium] innocuum]|nr:hypothetical protein [[Clostridium] innocuum]MCG4663153.1 hypothetical protein [[Clostridium] innocuum]
MEYKEYVELIKRQIRTQDCRERVYQDNIIRPFLQSVFMDLDIEPVDIKIPSEIHEYEQYCGTYFKDKKELPATPDLCITSEWHWNNKEVDVDYKGVVEIKSPILNYITGFPPSKYNCLEEIERHLQAKKNTKVILTDGVTWTFYDKDNGFIKPVIEPICLGELEYRYKKSKYNKHIVERTKGRIPIVEDIHFPDKNEKMFNKLKDELKMFIQK